MSHDSPTTTHKINKERIDSEFIRNKLKLKSLEVKDSFAKKYPEAQRFLTERAIDLSKIRDHSAKVITTGALTGSLLFATPYIGKDLPPIAEVIKNVSERKETSDKPNQEALLEGLKDYLPKKVEPLTRSQEKYMEKIIGETIGIPARASLEGEHLNTTYGYIGAEQHLMRYPGDTMAAHPKVPEKDEGMASGKGAWGYVPSEIEKWHAVVQTLYLPDWSARQPYLANWYKFRKVLIINTVNGNAVVAAIADAGPAAWTGKHFGGSPEVMNYLGGSRYKKGPVILFFVDDPENKIKLGPVDYNSVSAPGMALSKV